MNILSIDVGIKNLALCLFNIKNNKDCSILKWDVVNLCNEKIINCQCGKKANYTYNNIFSCKKHVKDHNKSIIPPELEMKKIKKMKINDLRQLLINNNIEFDHKLSKILLMSFLDEYLNNNYFTPFSSNVNTNDLNLIDIGINLKNKLDELYNNIDISSVIIENQISPIANRMKSLQGMIAQYFISKDVHDIHFISASNKLKDYVSTKTTYSERKSKGIEVCEELLINNDNFSCYLDMFNNHKKKDDLADCFLQGMWFLKDRLIYY